MSYLADYFEGKSQERKPESPAIVEILAEILQPSE